MGRSHARSAHLAPTPLCLVYHYAATVHLVLSPPCHLPLRVRTVHPATIRFTMVASHVRSVRLECSSVMRKQPHVSNVTVEDLTSSQASQSVLSAALDSSLTFLD